MSSTTKSYLNPEYLQSFPTHSYDSSQSPLALLAQTCSSIGKDSSSSPLIPSPTTSPVTKSSSSNLLNSDKSFSSTKPSSLSQSNYPHTNKNSTLSLKTKTISSSSSFIEPNFLSTTYPPPFDPTTSLATLLLRSSLPYLSFPQHSYSTICTIPTCLQCETVRHLLATSINLQPYPCHWKTCQARFSSNDQLIEHIRSHHRPTKTPIYPRYHPYFKPLNSIYRHDQLPYFYPHLSLSSTSNATRQLNNNPEKKNN